MKQKFPATTTELIEILENLLRFNPELRGSSQQILRSKYFNDMRDESYEKPAKAQVKIDIDEDEEFDYTSNSMKTLTSDDLRLLISNF